MDQPFLIWGGGLGISLGVAAIFFFFKIYKRHVGKKWGDPILKHTHVFTARQIIC